MNLIILKMDLLQVKIHPKMIYNRPPLNCQKCQFRFFTDQGLERHLLGSHGLVTASMQDAANKGQDSGRCPVCGKVNTNNFTQKLFINDKILFFLLGLPMEIVESRCKRPWKDIKTCTLVLQMYSMYSNLWSIQAF